MPEAALFGPALIAAGLPLLGFALLGRDHPIARSLGALVATIALLRYLTWRWTESLPEDQALAGQIWAVGFLVIESLGGASSLFGFMFLTRSRDRRAEADAGEHTASPDTPVDIFICTYNEGYPILERTIAAAVAVAHRDLRVWVLDDGARDWVRALAAEMGARYVCRVKGTHAKAGNVNNGLAHALASDRPPEFVLLLDADFTAHANILARTLPLFREADVGIVQTPQHFFNPDPIQSNLLSTRSWPDEQRYFFNVLLPAKDAWGAAFCCGTSAVFRVEALRQAGGMAVETVTEDMLTTFKLAEHGWRTVFLNERLSLGLAPEGLGEFVTQRARWCLGALQQVYTRWSFAGVGYVSPINRLSCLDGVLYWTATFISRLLALAAPAVFWWTGASCMTATNDDLVFWFLPNFVACLIFMGTLSRRMIVPLLTDVTQLVCAVPIARTVGLWLVRPFGHPFKVTDKGATRNGIVVHWSMLAPFALIAVATILGMAFAMSPWSSLRGEQSLGVNVTWSFYNLVVLALGIAACVELPRPRAEERFPTNEVAVILSADGARHPCRLSDISLVGAALRDAPEALVLGARATLLLDDGSTALPFEVARRGQGGALGLRFQLEATRRRALIARLHGGRYANEVEEADLRASFGGALRRLFG